MKSGMLTFCDRRGEEERGMGSPTVRGNGGSGEAKELGANLDGEDLVGRKGTGWGFAGTSGGGRIGVSCHGGGGMEKSRKKV